jgi:hypothetical protein
MVTAKPSTSVVHHSSQLAFLLARGQTVEQCAESMGLSEDEVFILARVMGFRIPFKFNWQTVSARAEETLVKAARKRGITGGEMVTRIMEILGEDPILLRNVIDDGH